MKPVHQGRLKKSYDDKEKKVVGTARARRKVDIKSSVGRTKRVTERETEREESFVHRMIRSFVSTRVP